MLMNIMDDLIFYDEEEQVIKQEFSKEIWELTEKKENTIGSNFFEDQEFMYNHTSNLITTWSVDEIRKRLLFNPVDYFPVSVNVTENFLYKEKYRIKFSFIPLPNRAERVKAFMDGDLFGDVLVTDFVRLDYYTAKIPSNSKKDLPVWKIIAPVYIGHTEDNIVPNFKDGIIMYDESGSKAYAALSGDYGFLNNAIIDDLLLLELLEPLRNMDSKNKSCHFDKGITDEFFAPLKNTSYTLVAKEDGLLVWEEVK